MKIFTKPEFANLYWLRFHTIWIYIKIYCSSEKMAYPLVYFFIFFIFLTALLVHNCSSVWENFSTMVGFGKQSIDPFHLTHIDAKYIEKLAKGHQEISKKWNIFPGILWILLSSHSSNIICYTINVFTNLMKQTLKMIRKIDSIMCVKMSTFYKKFYFPRKELFFNLAASRLLRPLLYKFFMSSDRKPDMQWPNTKSHEGSVVEYH